MNREYSNYWWIYLVRGIFAILFGITTMIVPGASFTTLVVFFGTFMIADGVFSIMFSTSAKKAIKNKQWMLFVGITGIVAGILTLFNPFISAIILVCFFAFWSFFAGIMEMFRAVNLRQEKRKEAWYVMSGILSILVAILLFVNPLEGPVTLAMVFGMYAMVIGISLISLSIKLKKKFTVEKNENIIAGSSV
jgi:uncharacterized membrane protein HdeD (DUF308 family)